MQGRFSKESCYPLWSTVFVFSLVLCLICSRTLNGGDTFGLLYQWYSLFNWVEKFLIEGDCQTPLASVLLSILSDLLFCPGFTVSTLNKSNRAEILKLLLTCFSEVIYAPVTDENRLRWVTRFTSVENRHVLPLFTSMLNVVCAYDPVGMGLPYNYLLFNDYREPLVEITLQYCFQALIVCLDKDSQPQGDDTGYADNYFINYLGRIHREEDFDFMLKV
uniref:Protein HID1 n=1 Tax=Heterorhabditis bacteriophora TaxID=37862 RepID=A0A1I7W881_HETBA